MRSNWNRFRYGSVSPAFAMVFAADAALFSRSLLRNSAMPPGDTGAVFARSFHQSINAILDQVGRSALIAFGKRRKHRILFLTQPGIAQLEVILVFCATYTEVPAIFFVLAAKI